MTDQPTLEGFMQNFKSYGLRDKLTLAQRLLRECRDWKVPYIERYLIEAMRYVSKSMTEFD